MDQAAVIGAIIGAIGVASAAFVSGLFLRSKNSAEAKNIVVTADKTAAQMWQEWADEQKQEAARIRADLMTERSEARARDARAAAREQQLLEEVQKATAEARKSTAAAELAAAEATQCKQRVIQLETVLRHNGIPVPEFVGPRGEE